MRYTKPALSFEDQSQRLLDRGLNGIDKNALMSYLSLVNYYRLSAYWYPFKQIDQQTGVESFQPNTSFEIIWERYIFDRKLRLLVMDAIEYIEVAILRTRIVEQFTLLHGPFGYCDINNFNPNTLPSEYSQLMQEIKSGVNRSSEDFIARFRTKYSSEPNLPLWVVVETMTFGQLFTLFKMLDRNEQRSLAKPFGIHPKVMNSWLKTLNYVRNVCAHHGCLWNRHLSINPLIPYQNDRPEFYIPKKVDNRWTYSVLTLIQYLLQIIAPQCSWKENLFVLLDEYPSVPLYMMGFPDKWRDCPIWQ